jgi:hypothetical protein
MEMKDLEKLKKLLKDSRIKAPEDLAEKVIHKLKTGEAGPAKEKTGGILIPLLSFFRTTISQGYLPRTAAAGLVLALALLIVVKIEKNPGKHEPVVIHETKNIIPAPPRATGLHRSLQSTRRSGRAPQGVPERTKIEKIASTETLDTYTIRKEAVTVTAQKQETVPPEKSVTPPPSRKEKDSLVSIGYSLGQGYNSYMFSAYFLNPRNFRYGMDALLLNWGEARTSSTGYLSFIHIGKILFQKKTMNADWFLGLALAQKKYNTASSDLVLTPGIGIMSEYILSDSFSICSKVTGIIYSNSLGVPYQFGLTYRYGRFTVSTGLQGMFSIISATDFVALTNDIGNMITVRYDF